MLMWGKPPPAVRRARLDPLFPATVPDLGSVIPSAAALHGGEESPRSSSLTLCSSVSPVLKIFFPVLK